MSIVTLRLSWYVLMASLTGCVLSKSTVEERTPELKYATTGTLALTVVDNRPYVLDNDKDETFEGFQRLLYGIPQSFTKLRDDDKIPFSIRFADIISHALNQSGSKVSVVATEKGASVPQAITHLQTVPFTKGLVVNVLDSKVDAGGFRWSFYYDYDVVVVDTNGAIRSNRKFKGEDVDFQREIFHQGKEKGKSYELPAVLDIEYANRVKEFLNDNETRMALVEMKEARKVDVGPKSPSKDESERLIELKTLLDKGLITPEDYERKKKEILDSL